MYDPDTTRNLCHIPVHAFMTIRFYILAEKDFKPALNFNQPTNQPLVRPPLDPESWVR